jgi:hypothetical protein
MICHTRGGCDRVAELDEFALHVPVPHVGIRTHREADGAAVCDSCTADYFARN